LIFKWQKRLVHAVFLNKGMTKSVNVCQLRHLNRVAKIEILKLRYVVFAFKTRMLGNKKRIVSDAYNPFDFNFDDFRLLTIF